MLSYMNPITLFLLIIFWDISPGILTQTPLKLTNPDVQIRICPLMPGWLSLYNNGNFVNPQFLITDSWLMATRGQYQIFYNNTFSHMPLVGLGVYQMQYDPRYYDQFNAVLRARVSNVQMNYFYINLIIGYASTSISFIDALKVFYFAVDPTFATEICAVQYFQVQTPYLAVTQPDLQQWRHSNHTVNFWKSPMKWGRVRYITSIVGQKYTQKNYTMISATAVAINSSSYYLRVSAYNHTTIEEVSCYVIAIDMYIAEAKLREYQFANLQYNGNATNVLKDFTTQVDRIFISYNYFSLKNSSAHPIGFDFFWDNGNAGTIKRWNNLGIVKLNVLQSFIYDCPMGQFFDPLTKTCLTQCNGTFPPPINRVCKSCTNYCLNCFYPSHCTTCISTRQPDANNYRCVCKSRYYQKGEELCELCASRIFGCATCNSANNCTRCDVDLQFNETAIDNTTCLCQNNRYLDSNNLCVCNFGYYDHLGTCKKCHYSCVNCNGLSQFDCTECNLYVYRSLLNGVCQCATQWRFDELCTIATPSCDPSICYLDPTIDLLFSFDPTSLRKDPQNNILIYTINIQPELQFLNYIFFNESIDLGIGQGTTSTFKYENGVLTMYASYSESVQGNSTQLIISLLTASLSFMNVPNYTLLYTVQPVNNLAANVYTESQYTLRKVFKYSCYVLVALTFVVFGVGAYSSKVIVTQMMGIVQAAFLGLFMLNYNDPMIESLEFLKYSNGFNDLISNPSSNIPSRISLLGYSELVTNNLNVAALVILLPLLSGLIFLIISQVKRRGKLTMLSYFKLCMGEWTFFFVLFSLYNLSTSTALFVSHVRETVRDWRFTVSIVEIAILFTLVTANLFLYGFTDYNFFGQFKCMFKWNKFELNYYYFHATMRIIVGLIIGFANYSYIAGASVSGVFLLLGLLTIVKRPYSDSLQSIRSSVNLLVGSIIFLLFTAISFNGPTNGNNFFSRIPIVIIILLYGVVSMAIGFIARQYVMMNKGQPLVDQQLSNPLDLEKKQLNETIKKKIQEELQKGGSENSFAKKLFLAKNKKPKRKKPQVKVEHDFATEKVQTLKLEPLNMSNANMLEDDEKGLTLQRIRMVDTMLKEGLL